MAYDIIHKNSTVAGTPPAAGEIEVGEIAINAADAALYVKDTNGNVKNVVTDALFVQAGTGAVQRTVKSKLQDVVSVKDFGAVGDGVADDTAAFQAAAKGVQARVNVPGARGSLPCAPMCKILVPAGTYLLTSEIDTGNREVLWEVDQAAVITGYSFINGEIHRAGQRLADAHHGSTDYACTYSIRSNNPDLEATAEVLGVTSAAQLATYTNRDTVSLYVDNTAPPATYDVATATYTNTTATITAPNQAILRKYRRGMIIDTKHSPRWCGIVDSWNADGSVITVTGWYQFGGVGSPGTPPNGTGLVLNGFTKVWAHNANVFLQSDSYAPVAAGFELGVINNRGPLNYAASENSIWGFDAVNLGNFEGAAGFIVRTGPTAKFFRGFVCDDASSAGFYVGGTPGAGFWSEQTSGAPFRYDKAGVLTFYVDNNGSLGLQAQNGNITLGAPSAVNSPYIDFNSSGIANDYDVRIRASGGAVGSGNGLLTITAGFGVEINGQLYSGGDNVNSCGLVSRRWTVIYAASGTINTSDEREKQDISSLDDAEKRVAVAIKGLVKKFRFKDAVTKKGDKARIHVGVIAQEVVQAFTAEGLDAHDYGIVCYDEWDETPEVTESWEDTYDVDGNFVKPAGTAVVCEFQPAGNRYGIRYEELLAFIIAAL